MEPSSPLPGVRHRGSATASTTSSSSSRTSTATSTPARHSDTSTPATVTTTTTPTTTTAKAIATPTTTITTATAAAAAPGTVQVPQTPEDHAFHLVFPQLPASERLVESCACGLMRAKLLRMGRLYLTALRLAFSSSFLQQPLLLTWEDVAAVTLRTSIMFDAITVRTKLHEEYSFSAFMSGGTSQIFRLMRTLWAVRERYTSTSEAAMDASSTASLTTTATATTVTTPLLLSGDDAAMATTTTASPARSPRNGNDDGVSAVVAQTTEAAAATTHAVTPPATPRSRSTAAAAAAPLGAVSTSPARERAHSEPPHGKDDTTTTTTVAAMPRELAEGVAEVRQLFPQIASDEAVSHVFHCSHVNAVHQVGKLYLTTHYVLFASPMTHERITIELAQVDHVDKEQTLLILDGISLHLYNHHTVSFTNFVSRDNAYNALVAAKRRYDDGKAAAAAAADVANKHTQGRNGTTAAATTGAAATPPAASPPLRTTTCGRDLRNMPDATSLDEQLAQVQTDYGSAFSSMALFTTEALSPSVLPPKTTLIDVFACAFDDDTTLLARLHHDRGDTDVKCQPWRRTSDGGALRGQRLFECTTTIRAMMNKRCCFTEYQRYAFARVNGTPTLVVHFSSQVSGVMYSDTFRTELLCVFTQAGGDGDSHAVVTMRAYSHVQFLKSVWIRAKIASTATSEQQDGAKRLYELIVECLLTRATSDTVATASASAVGAEHTATAVAADVAPAAHTLATSAPAGAAGSVPCAPPDTRAVVTTAAAAQARSSVFVPYVRLHTESASVWLNVVLFALALAMLLTCVRGVLDNVVVHSSGDPLRELVQHVVSLLCGIGVFVSLQCLLDLYAALRT